MSTTMRIVRPLYYFLGWMWQTCWMLLIHVKGQYEVSYMSEVAEQTILSWPVLVASAHQQFTKSTWWALVRFHRWHDIHHPARPSQRFIPASPWQPHHQSYQLPHTELVVEPWPVCSTDDLYVVWPLTCMTGAPSVDLAILCGCMSVGMFHWPVQTT